MRFTLCIALALLAAPVAAELPPPPPPHDPLTAECKMKTVIAAIDVKDRSNLSAKLRIYSEKLGLVEDSEFDSFFNEFEASNSKYKKLPLEIRNAGFVRIGSGNPIYAITLQRGVGDGGHWSAWMVEFNSNEVARLRRADEIWPFAADNNIFHSTTRCAELKSNG